MTSLCIFIELVLVLRVKTNTNTYLIITQFNSQMLAGDAVVEYKSKNVIIFVSEYLNETGRKNSCHAVAFRSDRREVRMF